jgi:hypothetical protein
VTDPDELLALRRLSRATLEAAPDATVDAGVSYGRLRPVDRIHAESVAPAHFYFDNAELKLVYVPRSAVGAAPADEWLQRLGPGPQLASRTGKRAVLEVRPDIGFAFAHDQDAVELAEVFPPMTLDDYEREIYEPPEPFIR